MFVCVCVCVFVCVWGGYLGEQTSRSTTLLREHGPLHKGRHGPGKLPFTVEIIRANSGQDGSPPSACSEVF